MADASPSPPPKTMRAWQYSSTSGGLEKNLKINPSAALPKLKPNQHLVRISAMALNPVDYKPAQIPGVARLAVGLPATPGIDFCGRLITPAKDSPLKAGQMVFGCAGNNPVAGGALGEYAVAGLQAVAALPEGMEVVDAATVGVAGTTAYQSIVPRVKAGDRVFVNGGSGGVGVFSVQFAKTMGCYVVATCGTGNVEFVKGLGVDRVVDYRTENVVEVLKGLREKEGGFDHAVDNVGTNEELVLGCHEFMKKEASYVIVGGEPTLQGLKDILKRKLLPGFLGGVKGKVEGFFPAHKTEDFEKMAEWMTQGKVKAVIDSRFKYEEAVKAFEKLKTGRARGKIVVDEPNSRLLLLKQGVIMAKGDPLGCGGCDSGSEHLNKDKCREMNENMILEERAKFKEAQQSYGRQYDEPLTRLVNAVRANDEEAKAAAKKDFGELSDEMRKFVYDHNAQERLRVYILCSSRESF
ncbi:putative secondary metabolism biosynthetic enzyme [Bacidia gigantensis]|uniref:putative secondary metabolism biosynthetic enzyme n=1 Tax=Bacidia gigantensis TaxID=2732470 RepID=UPI001D04BFE4|nr:putative secondary metabolism biosynthetic enzyme [Bacidia gigantensis]KAG8528381.1 putative secondary metabolism biosynthetic enzyme [Bacidia gigantensis]